MMSAPVLETARFTVRRLELTDVTLRYLSWFRKPAAEHIVSGETTHTIDDLKTYVVDKIHRPDVVFLAIIDRMTQLHIGNLKYEPVDLESGHAVFGIFIGEDAFRGKGVTGEVVAVSAAWLKTQGVKEIALGVAADHTSAIRSYEKAGFRIGETPHLPDVPGVHRMVLLL